VGDVTPRSRLYGGTTVAPVEEMLHRRHRPDYWLLLLSIGLLLIGLVVIYSISPALGLANGTSSSFFVTRQALAIALSAIAFIIGSSIPLQTWRRWYMPLLILAIITTLLALVIPVNPAYPAHRWVRLGTLSFQSVEFIKFALLLWLSAFLGERIRNSSISNTRSTLKPLFFVLLLTGLIVAGVQSDLGSAVVIVAMMGTMAFIAGMPFKRLLVIGSILIILGVLAISVVPYRRERLVSFLHPTSNCQSSGYQACQALISVGSGGLIGLGLGRSIQAYGYLPEAANDSIFAIYAEKFGFIGVALLLTLFTALFTKLKVISERAPDNFSRLFVIGTLVWISVQTIINIGAMIGLLPLKGITLPLVSYGGTSVVFIMAALGVVFQISRYTHYVTEEDTSSSSRRSAARENRIDRRRVRGAYNPDLGSRG
jgi:cell division protein FtsW